MAVLSDDMGGITAYAAAVNRGYTGTKEEFEQLMYSYTEVAERAEAAAGNAHESEEASIEAKDIAVGAKNEAVSARDAAVSARDASISAKNDSESARDASISAKNDTLAAKDAVMSAKGSVDETSANFSDAVTAAISDVNAAGRNQKELAKTHAIDSEAWAVGQREGADVGVSDETYHNNSKYYAEQSALAKSETETARDDAVSAKTAAQTAQAGAETAAASVQSSAAQIATNTSDISELKEDLIIDTDRSMIIDIDNLRKNGMVVLSPVYINNTVSSGNIGNPSNNRVTTQNLIYVPKNAKITYRSTENYVLTMHLYDAERNYLGYSAFGQLPSNAYYFRPLFVYSNSADISASDVATNVVFTITATTTDKKIEDAIEAYNTSAETKFIQKQIGKNLLNPSDVVVGYLKNDGDIYSTATQYRTSNYIPIESGQAVTISPRTRIFAFYDSSKTMISGSYMNTETQNYTGTASVDGYFRFSYYYADEYIQAEYGTTPTNYEPYTMVPEPIVGLSTMQKTQINNMISSGYDFSSIRVGIFGDSIMHGAGNPQDVPDGYYGIGDILHELFGLSFDDRCVSGALVEYIEGRETKAVYQQVNEAITAQENYDLIIMDGLSNDIVHGTLGELTTSFDFLTNGYNDFTSALEYCFGKLKTAYPEVPVLYVIPHSSNGRDYTNELNFGNRAREICKKWSIPIADVYMDGNMTARIPQQLQEFTNYPTETTGTHPNRAGYDYAYIPLIVAWMKNAFANMN